jgi:hypothetical protein
MAVIKPTGVAEVPPQPKREEESVLATVHRALVRTLA